MSYLSLFLHIRKKKVGLSMIGSAIGDPKMVDSFTNSMCVNAWGRCSYARALIEVSAEHPLKDVVNLAIPEVHGDGFIKETMKGSMNGSLLDVLTVVSLDMTRCCGQRRLLTIRRLLKLIMRVL